MQENQAVPEASCPYCKSTELVPYGTVIRAGRGRVQRFACKSCGRSFTPPKEFELTKTQTPDDAQDLLLSKRPELDRINRDRARKEKFLTELEENIEKLSNKYFMTSEEVSEMVRKLKYNC
jgi:transposase-like protein